MSVDFEKSKLVSYIHTINGRPCPVEDEFLLYDGQWMATGFRTFESVPPHFRVDRESFTNQMTGFRALGLGGKEAKTDCYPVRYRADHRSETWTVVVVSDEPFALINQWRGLDESCEIAKEVIDNEPKRLPAINQPSFQRGAKHWGWIKLTRLADFMKRPAKDVWRTYGHAAIGSNCPTMHPRRQFADVLHITLDSCDSEIQIARCPGESFSALHTIREWREADFPNEYRWAHEVLDRMFVPAGWAMNVLYLDWLGYEKFSA